MPSYIPVLDLGFVQLVDSMGNDKSIVDAARVSFGKDTNDIDFNQKDSRLLSYLWRNKHTSPFEMVQFKFHVKCPLIVRGHIFRHRTGKFNEVSRRYTSDDIHFYIPTEFRKQSDNNRQASTDEVIREIEGNSVESIMSEWSKMSKFIYDNLIEQGVAREQARMVLPQNMYTRFYFSIDLHNLLHFIEIRDHADAQYETRLYAKAFRDIIEDVVPNTVAMLKGLNETEVSSM